MSLLDHLRLLEEQLLDPAIRQNPAALTHLLAPDFLEFGSSGRTYTRDEIVAELTSAPAPEPPRVPKLRLHDLRLHDLRLHDLRLHAASATWAILTYRTSRPASANASPGSTLRSSTWVLRDARWQLLFHQGTPQTSVE